MRYSTAMIVAAISIGEAVAGPAHAHLHRHARAHEKRDVDWAQLDWTAMVSDWSSAWAAGQHTSTSAPAPAPTPAASSATVTKGAVFAQTTAAAASTTATSTSSSASSSASSSSDTSSDASTGAATLWNGLVGLANKVTSFGEATANSGSEVSATGNIGAPQGSNMMMVSSVGSYQFTNEFINTSPSSLTVVCWNKAYSRTGSADDADPNLGSCVAPETPTLTFALAPGEKQIVAFQEGSIVGWAAATDAKSPSGAFAITWGEGKFWSSGSGFDMSSILNPDGNNYNMTIVGNGCTSGPSPSTPHWEAQNNNAEYPIPVGGSDGSCYIPGSSATLVTYMGGVM